MNLTRYQEKRVEEMSTEFLPNGFARQYLIDEHLSAVNDLIFSFDACAASFHMLRRLAGLAGCQSAFLATISGKRTADGDWPVVAAWTGNLFAGVDTFSELKSMTASYGWADSDKAFRTTLNSDESQTQRILVGYPLFDPVGRLNGVLMMVTYAEESIHILEELGPLFVFLLLHRIHEFTLMHSLRVDHSPAAKDIMSVRGTHFPLFADIIYKGLHDINGQLAIASLQTQILRNQNVPLDASNRGLERLQHAVVSAGELVSVQDEAMSLLLDTGNISSFRSGVKLALATFGDGLKNQIEFLLVDQLDGDVTLASRGNVAHWLLHNLFRAVATVYQWAPERPTAPIQVEMKPRIDPDRESPGLVIHLPSSELLLGVLGEITSDQPPSFAAKSLPGMVDLVRKVLVLCGGDFNYTESLQGVDIIVVLPRPPLDPENDRQRTLQ